jgi:acylphosphatase
VSRPPGITVRVVPVRRQVLVTGRVHGVWFRDSTRAEAERLGVTGWVRNLADGRVEVEVEGPPEAVEALVAWAHRGPPRATVRDVAVEVLPVEGGADFTVRPDGAGQGRA